MGDLIGKKNMIYLLVVYIEFHLAHCNNAVPSRKTGGYAPKPTVQPIPNKSL